MLDSIIDFLKALVGNIGNLFSGVPTIGGIYTTIARWVFVFLAIYILLRAIRSLLSTKTPSEIWAYLSLPDGETKPLAHWENVIGRSQTVDVPIDIMTVSRNHGTLVYNDLGSKGGSKVNGNIVYKSTPVKIGDTISLGGADCVLVPASLEEQRYNQEARSRMTKKFTPWRSLVALTIFQVMVVIQFMFVEGDALPSSVPIAFGIFTAIMWIYSITIRTMGTTSFEIESIAFFLSTLGLAVTATSAPSEMVLGMALFLGLC